MTGSSDLRVTLKIDGGLAYFPGLSGAIEVSVTMLDDRHAAELKQLCDEALTASRESAIRPAERQPDSRCYRFTIERASTSREIVATDPIGSPAIERLVSFVLQHGRR